MARWTADELDAIFHAFKQGKLDILVATTIVENGIDIPNANTILIDRADTLASPISTSSAAASADGTAPRSPIFSSRKNALSPS